MRASSWDSLMSALAFSFDKVMRSLKVRLLPRVVIVGDAGACPSSDHLNSMPPSSPLVVSDISKGINETKLGGHLAEGANKEIVIALPCSAISPRPDNRQLDPSVVSEESHNRFRRRGRPSPS